MPNLLLINDNIEDYEKILDACNDDTHTICYNQAEDTYQTLLTQFSELDIDSNVSNVAIMAHNSGDSVSFKLLDNETPMTLGDSDSNLDTWNNFIDFLKNLNVASGANVDFLACALLAEPNWQWSLNKLEEKLGDLNVNVRASDDNTGNLKVGGDWVLESDNVNIKDVYFTGDIGEWWSVLRTNWYNYVQFHYGNVTVDKYTNGGSVITWGDDNYGADSSTVASDISSGIIAIYSMPKAFAALDSSGNVEIWGTNTYAGDSNMIKNKLSSWSGITSIYSNNNAFAGLDSSGGVKVIGHRYYGGGGTDGYPPSIFDSDGNFISVASDISSGITAIYSTYGAFAALNSSGGVITWGHHGYGGDSSNVASDISSGITAIYSTKYAFAALDSSGGVHTWGHDDYGGDSSDVAIDISSGITAIYSTEQAFAALDSSGGVHTWGGKIDDYGGDSSNVASDISSGIIAICSTQKAFAALNSFGRVTTWGHNSNGGDSSSVASEISSGITAIYSTQYAFAALDSSGGVTTWGYGPYGGSISYGNYSNGVNDITSGITAIYSSERAFAALDSSGGVITWGHNSYGGDSSSVASDISSGITTIYSTQRAFAALKGASGLIDESLNGSGGGGSGSSLTLTEKSPADGSVDILPTASITLTFSADVSGTPDLSGSISITPAINGKDTFSTEENSDDISISGEIVTIHTGRLRFDTQYRVDISANAFVGFDSSDSFSFTTIGPPSAGAQGITQQENTTMRDTIANADGVAMDASRGAGRRRNVNIPTSISEPTTAVITANRVRNLRDAAGDDHVNLPPADAARLLGVSNTEDTYTVINTNIPYRPDSSEQVVAEVDEGESWYYPLSELNAGNLKFIKITKTANGETGPPAVPSERVLTLGTLTGFDSTRTDYSAAELTALFTPDEPLVRETFSFTYDNNWHPYTFEGVNFIFKNPGIASDGGGGGADPYLYPALSSVPLKLPNKHACYRLYENPISETYINASVTQATPEHQLRMLNFAKSKTPKTHNVICDGYFFDAFQIISEGNTFHINLQNKKVTMNATNEKYFTMELKKNSTYKCAAFNGYCNKLYVSWTNEESGKNYKISVNFFSNPHVENGIQLISADYNQAVGCLVRNYRPKLMELPNVSVGKYNKLHSKLRRTKKKFQSKQIKGKNEVWHYGKKC